MFDKPRDEHGTWWCEPCDEIECVIEGLEAATEAIEVAQETTRIANACCEELRNRNLEDNKKCGPCTCTKCRRNAGRNDIADVGSTARSSTCPALDDARNSNHEASKAQLARAEKYGG